MTDDLDSGAAVLRKALIVRSKQPGGSLVAIARDLNIPPLALETWAFNSAGLTPEYLVLLAPRLLGPHVAYDDKIDKLRPAKRQEPTPLCTAFPPPYKPTTPTPTNPGGHPGSRVSEVWAFIDGKHQLVAAPPPLPPVKRPGWID